MEFRAFPVGC